MDKLTVIFESTLKAIENSKEEIFNIYEMTRNEIQRLKKSWNLCAGKSKTPSKWWIPSL